MGQVGVTTQGVHDFEVNNDNDKWEYRNSDAGFGEVDELNIDWKGAEFKYDAGDGLKLKTRFVGGAETTLQIEAGGGTGAFTLMVNGTVIAYDADRNITANVEFDPDGDNKKVSFTLPYQLQPEMLVQIDGAVQDSILVADHYKEGRVKFEFKVLFDAALVPDAGFTTPQTLGVSLVLGDTVFALGDVEQPDWGKIEDDKWEL